VYCWTYATEWSTLTDEVEALGAVGPLFVSIGNPGKLQTFLEKNPTVPQDRIFVDDLETFSGYRSLGFQKFGWNDIRRHWKTVEFPPKLSSIVQGFQYVTSIPSIGPFVKGQSLRVPEGGLVMGGTYVIAGNEIVYEWRDKLPGDLPDPRDVLSAMEEQIAASRTNAAKALSSN